MTNMPANETLRISEIFFSLQGETSRVGLPTVFIRLTGCPLRCNYCDTTYAFTGGNTMALTDIMAEVAQHPTHYVCVTGGEPLAQKNVHALLRLLCDAGYAVSLETSGALDVSAVDTRVMKILDIKTPASGEVSKNLWSNLEYLSPTDEIKFVLCDEADYQWAKHCLSDQKLSDKCSVIFSPSQGQISATDLAEWILRDGLTVRLQVQLHKFMGNEKGK